MCLYLLIKCSLFIDNDSYCCSYQSGTNNKLNSNNNIQTFPHKSHSNSHRKQTDKHIKQQRYNQMPTDFQSSLTYASIQLSYTITMFAMWGLGVDLPRLLARYARSYPMVINIHSISMMIIGLMTFLYVIARTVVFYTQNWYNGQRMEGVVLAQFVLAWILCGCIVVQFGLGFRLRYQMITDTLNSQMFNLKRVHRYLGTFMSVLGKVIVALLLQPYTFSNQILFRTWLFVIGALFLVYIILEVVYRVQTRSFMFKFPLKHHSKHAKLHDQILEKLNSNIDNFRDYHELGVRYLILDNKMYYIDQNFIHPGGQHIFTLYNGQQVNYLFRGTHQASAQYPRHNHTKYAMNYLQARLVGEIRVESILFNFNASSQQLVDWKMTALQKMDNDSYFVEFQSSNAYVKQNLNVENFGKYMMISCPSEQVIGKVQRPYSLVISLSNQQQNILHRFKQAYKSYYVSEGSSSANLLKMKSEQNLFDANQRKSCLTFCIKSYRHGLFTKFMFSSQTQRKFMIKGPYGRGLKLKPMSKGYYIIVAAGTGIVPFVDLFHYLLQKTLIKLIKARSGQAFIRKLNEQRIQYEYLDDVKILFIGSFESPKHFYLCNVLKDLYHLNIKYNLNNFDMRLRYNNNDSQPGVQMITKYFDKAFFEDLVGQKPDRIYYCGPPSIQQTIRKVQAENNLDGLFYFV